MTLLSSKKPIFRQPRSFKSLDILLFVWIGHSPDRALFPPEVITLVVVSSLFTLIHSDLAFSPVSISSLSSQDPYSDYICVKVLFSNHSPLQFLNLYSPPITSTSSYSRSRTFSLDILPNSPDTLFLGDFNAHHPSWDSLISPDPPGTCFTGSLPPVWKS